MEIVGIEGILTDAEVYEVLQSAPFRNVSSIADHETQFRKISKDLDTIKRKLRQTDKPNQKKPGVLSNSHRALEKKMETLSFQLAQLRRREDLTWIREQTLKYISQRPGSTQSMDDVDAFFQGLAQLQVDNKFELTSTEALQMANHRPTQAVEFQILVEHFYDRVTDPAVQEKIMALCEKLPSAPELDNGDSEQNNDQNEDTQLDRDLDEQEEMAHDEDQLLAAQEENEFNVDAKSQFDKDVDVQMDDD